MGCMNSAVQTLTVNGDEDDTGSKVSGRGDSAVSKGTADSGVVMENREIPGDIPGAVPRTLPLLTSESIRENVLLWDNEITERQKSHKILEELLNQGIIPKEQHREKSSRVGEAYSIMLDDNEGARRRPPARLESLKVKKAKKLHTREELEEKIRLAEERRKLKEDKLKMRLRSKSARVRVRVPAIISSTEKDKDTSITPVKTLAAPHPSQVMREAAEGGEWVREDGDGKRECEEEAKKAGKREKREEGGESREKEEEEEMTQVQEFTASGELECHSSFQHADDKEEVF
ncbi:stathmin domain-containing protein 1 [Neolamprologus brichardi]|uniref:stathmin domain-containing protein 1 n=1 Tax=Neolamprologus brichardi TaxID=32507 RepID=UPI0003EC529E|nr:stathmin domain-containing protein 1 [Neolamprologus brichardi]